MCFFCFVVESLLAKKEVSAHTRVALNRPTGTGQVTWWGGVCLTLAHNELQGLRSAGRGNVRESAEYTETTRPSMRTVHPAVGTRSSHVTAQPLRMGRPETVWVRETGWADRWAAARADRTVQARITGCTEEVQVPPPSSSSSPDNRAGPHDPRPRAAACLVLCDCTQEPLLFLSMALGPQPAISSLSRVQANTPTLRWAKPGKQPPLQSLPSPGVFLSR